MKTMRGQAYPEAVRRSSFAWMDHRHFAREGETALSPKRTIGRPVAAAKEGVRGGTMGSPTLNVCRCTGYDSIVASMQAAAESPSNKLSQGRSR